MGSVGQCQVEQAKRARRRAGPRGADGPCAVREREGNSGPEPAGWHGMGRVREEGK